MTLGFSTSTVLTKCCARSERDRNTLDVVVRHSLVSLELLAPAHKLRVQRIDDFSVDQRFHRTSSATR